MNKHPLISAARIYGLMIFSIVAFVCTMPHGLLAEEEESAVTATTTEISPDTTAAENPEHMDSILSTLNETLEENRSLRAEIEKFESTFRDISVENTVLKSQIQKVQTTDTQAEAEKQARITELSEKVKALQELETRLQEENVRYEEARRRSDELLTQVRTENEELSKVLSKSILESERDEYAKMIKEAEHQAKEASKEFSTMSYENEKLKKDLADSSYTLGNLLFQSGDYKNAIKEYEKALSINPADSWAHHNIGIIYDYYLNDHEKALEHYSKYLRFKPVEEEANEIRKRVLDLELSKEVVPRYPIKLDFDQYNRQRTT